VWITAFLSAGAGAFLGSRLSARALLIVASLVLGFIMFFVSIMQISVVKNWALAAEAGLCMVCFLLAFCLLVSKRFLWTPPNPTRLFWLLLVSALAVTVLVGGSTPWDSISSSPLLLFQWFVMLLPFWASVALAGRLRKDLQASPVLPPELPVEPDPTDVPENRAD
jgi:hypothetical protein